MRYLVISFICLIGVLLSYLYISLGNEDNNIQNSLTNKKIISEKKIDVVKNDDLLDDKKTNQNTLKNINSKDIDKKLVTDTKLLNDKKIDKNILKNKILKDTDKSFVSEENLFLITVFSLIVAFLSIAVSLYLYYWRYILISKNKFLIPENIVKEMSDQSTQFKNLTQYNVKVGEFVENQSKTSNSNIAELKNILVQFQKTLNEKDNLITRYQEGYDNKIFKNFIGRFYRVYKFLNDLEKKPEIVMADLNKIKVFLSDAFDESGVEVFHPQIGINYLEEGEILDDRPIVKITNNERDDNKVVEINSPGLRFIEKSINNRIIIKSKVTILQFKKDD
jgi:hypothetical protein